MTKRFFALCFTLALSRAQAQNTQWVYDFGTAAAAPYSSTTYSTGYLPAPQAGGGTAGVRACSATDGPVELVTAGLAGGAGAELKMTGGTTVNGAKFGLAAYSGTTVGTFQCTLNMATGTNGRYVIFCGNGSNFANGNGLNIAQVFAALRLSPNATGVALEWLSNASTSAPYTTSGLAQTSISKNQVYLLRFFMNNGYTNALYTTGSGAGLVTHSLAAGTFDIWLDDTKILANADGAAGMLPQGTAVNSMNLFNSVLGSSAPTLHVDDIRYANFLPDATPPPNQAPAVSLTAPAPNAPFSSPALVGLGADAADADGTITKVEFFHGANKLGEDMTPPYNLDWSNVPSGTYSLTAKATDNSGAVTTSAPVTITVADNGPLGGIGARYRSWLLDEGADYSIAAVRDRYNRFISSGLSARNLSGYDLLQPGAAWNFRTSSADETSFSNLVEQKLIRLVFLYQLKGPASAPNPNYHSPTLKDTILSVFNYLQAKGVGSTTDFVIDETGATESVDINNSVALRTSSYATAVLLMKDELKAAGAFPHHLATLQALTYFLDPAFPGFRFTYPGFNTDVVRVSTQQRLCYILAQDDTCSNRTANMDHLKNFLDNAVQISRGWSDCIKPDFSTYHHRGVYSNTYGENALHQVAILNLMVKGTPYELDATAQSNLKAAALAYNQFCQGFEMPRSLGGRFPLNTDAANDIRPTYAYLYLADPVANEDAGREFVRLWNISTAANTALIQSNTLSINPFHSVGGIQQMCAVLNAGLSPLPECLQGQFNFPYAGLSVHKHNGYQVSVKGTSKYIWHYENSATENIFGRYTSAGSLEILATGSPLTHESNGYTENGWDWSRTPGVTAAYLPLSVLGTGTHRLFSGKSFLAHASLDNEGVFAMDYQDKNSATPMTGRKTVFFFKDKLLCMGSNFTNPAGTYPLQTTLFQTALADTNTTTYVKGEAATGSAYSFTQTGGGFWATDAAGNGYVVPASAANTDSITVFRTIQQSRNQANTATTTGHFTTAYINHGVAPAHARYVYGLALQAGAAGTRDFADNFDTYFHVLQQDSSAHIGRYVPDSTYGYAIFNPAARFSYDLVKSVDKPAVVMTQKTEHGNRLKLSLTNPDLGLLASHENYTFNQITGNPSILYRTPPVEVVRLTLSGKWLLENPVSNVTATISGDSTEVSFSTTNGFTIQTSLVKATLAVTAMTDRFKSTDAGGCTYTVQGSELDIAATTNCGSLTYSYALSGATTATGTHSLAHATLHKGTTLVTWTVMDGCQTTMAASFNVTVNDTQAPAITPPASQSFTYQPGNSYTLPPLTAQDNCGIQSTTFVVAGATTRSGTGADASGTFHPGVSVIQWTVTDFFGNTDTATQSVTISEPACTGPHPPKNPPGGIRNGRSQKAGTSAPFDILLAPNPSPGAFTLRVNSSSEEGIRIQIADVEGRILKTLTAAPGKTFHVGHDLGSGIYFAEIIQGDQRKVLKLIKL
ncbi:chondroitinase family polysaccharide lyase [Paraflavisolibacter sp. H34]|uniref:chondroitinase family polysaccharide lyase n=1 Tax=Huijunlia imazamoxiresistens TaxID=3127457 RepID=UPI003016D317